QLAAQVDQVVEQSNQRDARFLFRSGRAQLVEVSGRHQLAVLEGDELQLLRGSLGRLHGDARPPGELLNGGWSRPAEEALTQCARHYRVVHGGQFQPPARVAVSLLVEASVDRYAPDRSFALQLAERERQRGRDPALLTRLAEVLHGRPLRVLE